MTSVRWTVETRHKARGAAQKKLHDEGLLKSDKECNLNSKISDFRIPNSDFQEITTSEFIFPLSIIWL